MTNFCTVSEQDMHRSAYVFDLPERLIAQQAEERGASRLMVLDRQGGKPAHAHFADLGRYLPKNAVLVVNNSRVIPARLLGHRPSGGRMELLVLTPFPLLEQAKQPCPGEQIWQAEADVLLKPAKAMLVGQEVLFEGSTDAERLCVTILAKGEFGKHRVLLRWQHDLQTLFEQRGHLPLPPYIHRPDTEYDKTRYQTIYARHDKAGSVAAPTAGLHFTAAMKEALVQQGITWAEVTLHVGYGTFSPVRCDDIREHTMHPEYVELSETTVRTLLDAKKQGRPVIAVGTTACRTLEGVAALMKQQHGEHSPLLEPYTGWINMFIWPGYDFTVIDGLITNFHLPESTLLMLVAALTGRQPLLDAYAEAVNCEYRFFSYGDAMLVR